VIDKSDEPNYFSDRKIIIVKKYSIASGLNPFFSISVRIMGAKEKAERELVKIPKPIP